jgi:hypothetical protein
MHPRLALLRAAAAALAVACVVAVLHAAIGRSFTALASGYAQHLYAVSSLKSNQATLAGVVVLQNGTVVSAECRATNTTRLHAFDPAATSTKHDSVLHDETVTTDVAGGCGITFLNVGGQDYIFSNINDTSTSDGDGTFGVSRIAWPSLATTKMAPGAPGNWLGIAVDPLTGDIVYAGATCRPANPQPPLCTIYRMNPATGVATPFLSLPGSQFGYIDGLAFEPTGAYLFLTNRTASPSGELDVVDRLGQVWSRTQLSTEPVGIGFHATSPKFVVTSNQNGTMTRFDFPGDDYSQPPAASLFASGGFRGDLMQAGPDGCLYVTQLQARYDNGLTDNNNSLVQICTGFAPPPGITPNAPPDPASFCGFVFADGDNDGAMDPGETGIAGVQINLSGTDSFDLAVNSSTTTGSSGAYCFDRLAPGRYTVSEVQPPAFFDGRDSQGTPGTGTTANDAFADVRLDAGVNGANNNFGELRPSSLGGFVYADADNNGTKAASEGGIAGATVTLTGTDDRGAAVNMPATTGADGAYLFTSLRPGTYTITEMQPAGYADGTDTQGTPGTGTTSNDVFSNIVLGPAVNGQSNNFGEFAPRASISIVKRTNGTDNDSGTGPKVAAGSKVTWTYAVTNSGNVPLSNLAVTDDKAGAVNCGVTELAAGASVTCSKSGTAVAGQYTNVGMVTATTPTGTTVSATNADHYFGLTPEKNPPTCTINSTKGPPLKVTMTFRDSGSGIARFEIVDAINLKMTLPSFTAPAAGPLVVTGTRIDPKKSTGMTIRAIDFFGNTMLCDPVTTVVTRLRHENGTQTFTGIPEAEHFVTVQNGSPGVRRLDVVVNGETFRVRKLDDSEIALIDIASAMENGPVNTVTLVPYGKKGDSALVMIADH